MMDLLYICGMGLIGAGIGWITNVVAIRLLFKPYEPKKIPLLNWSFQGLIPKRQRDIAAALGQVVSSELITGQDIAASIARHDIKEKITRRVQMHVQSRIRDKLPFILPQIFQETVAEYIGKALAHEVANFLEHPMQTLHTSDLEVIKEEIRKIVENKILALDIRGLEQITYQLAKAELKHIETMGGILGLLIGLLQGLITINIYK